MAEGREYAARLHLSPGNYGALMRFLIDHRICPELLADMIRFVPEILIACAITIENPEVHAEDCDGSCLIKHLTILEEELRQLDEHLHPDSEMGEAVRGGLYAINAARTVEEVDSELQGGEDGP